MNDVTADMPLLWPVHPRTMKQMQNFMERPPVELFMPLLMQGEYKKLMSYPPEGDIMGFNFEWDGEKASSNLIKHKVNFEEAVTVFLDPFSLTIIDSEHLELEDRYIDLGISDRGRLLVVVYTERYSNIRIISCRKANKSEKKMYESEGEIQ